MDIEKEDVWTSFWIKVVEILRLKKIKGESLTKKNI